MVTTVLQFIGGLAMVAGLLALNALALYLIWWVAMIAVSFLPMIGKRHRHPEWERLNRQEDHHPRIGSRREREELESETPRADPSRPPGLPAS